MSSFHLRCEVCNYCKATDGSRRKVVVTIDTSGASLCTTCRTAINPPPLLTEAEQAADLPTTRRERIAPPPTLPRVTGVNDGPTILFEEDKKEENDDAKPPNPGVPVDTSESREEPEQAERRRDLCGAEPPAVKISQ